MTLSGLAIRRSRVTVAGILVVAAFGVFTFLTYPRAEDPSVTIREVGVTASFPGMSPARIEKLIAKPVEAAMREIAGIDDIESTSRTGEMRLGLTIRDDVRDLEKVYEDIRNKAAGVRLPEGTAGPRVDDEVGVTAIATVALWADGFGLAEMRDVARDVRDRLNALDGVRKIEILGAQEERVYLEATPARMARLGISPRQILDALAGQNVIAPGGAIVADGRTLAIEPSGNLESLEEIGRVVFRVPDSGRLLRLDEVVTIRRALVDPPRFPSFYNDRPAIVLAVSTVDGIDNVAFGERLTAAVDAIGQELPVGYVLDYATFQPDLIARAVDSALANVYQTLAIVMAVVMVFLGIRTGLIVGSFVPLTILLGIVAMRFLEVELQRMSIAATIIALGLLVDNGIVMAEDIRVRLGRGVERTAAAAESVRTLALPLLTSSLTTVFAFLPMLLVEGATGEYVRSLAQVVAILLLGSWLLSMTVTPAMCAWFLRAGAGDAGTGDGGAQAGPMYRAYRRILGLFLRRRVAALAALAGALALSVAGLGTLKTEFFPLGDRDQFLIHMDLEAGTDARRTSEELRKLTAWLSESNPEIASHVAYVGYGGPRFFLALSPVEPDPHRAFVVVNLHSADDADRLVARVNRFADANLPAARVDARKMWFGSSEPGLVEVRLVGPDHEVLADRAGKLIEALHRIPGTVGIRHDWENRILTLVVEVDQPRARRAGIASSDVANALETTFSGLTVSDYRERDNVIPIVFRGDDTLRFSLSGLQRTQVRSPVTDSFVALDQVARVRPEWRFGRIVRRNHERVLTVEARNPGLPAPRLLAALGPALGELDLPEGYRWEIGGEIENQAEANSKLFGLVPLALAGIVVLLIAQFNSFRRAAIVLATVPLILIGGVLGLAAMGAPFGFMVILGFFSLAGVVINNGIVLIDRIEIERAAGREPLDAVVAACVGRLRPILMTTLTTVLGLVPLILFGGALFYGMASVIAFGLVVATTLTLGFVPALYTLLFRIPTADAARQAAAVPPPGPTA